MKTIDVSLATICSGEAVDDFDTCLSKVWEDIFDSTKDTEAKRSIHLKLTLSPKEDPKTGRISASYDWTIETKLPGTRAKGSTVYLLHGSDGVRAVEVDTEQMTIEDAIARAVENDRTSNVTAIAQGKE